MVKLYRKLNTVLYIFHLKLMFGKPLYLFIVYRKLKGNKEEKDYFNFKRCLA